MRHHSQHHQAHVTKFNQALAAHIFAIVNSNYDSLAEVEDEMTSAANAHFSHSLYWESLAPVSSGRSDSSVWAPRLTKAIEARFSTVENFKKEFHLKIKRSQSSGWVWLVLHFSEASLLIIQTENNKPFPLDQIPLLGVDIWNHAYHLQYFNDRSTYLEAIWKVRPWRRGLSGERPGG
jgi:Fe-Mn family superoxide dismutase